MPVAFAILAVIVGTWNGNWFPSGRAEHRAHPDVEAATVAATGRMLAREIARLDPEGKEELIVGLNEIRGPKVARSLAEAIGRTNLTLVSISAYRRRDRFDQQQDAILTTLPVAESSWSLWKATKTVKPPRGYAFAALVVSPAVTARVYQVHLKSNYGATTDEIKASNRAKRAAAVEQLVAQEKLSRGKVSSAPPVLVMGDVNADCWKKDFAGDTLFGSFQAAGFTNVLSVLPPQARDTCPHKRYGPNTLDYIFLRGAVPEGEPNVGSSEELSDHNPVFVRVRF